MRKTTKRTTRKVSRTTKRSPAKRKPAKRTTSKKGAFGGYKINFNGCNHSLEKVFGARPLAPSAMTKKLWIYVKRYKLAHQ